MKKKYIENEEEFAEPQEETRDTEEKEEEGGEEEKEETRDEIGDVALTSVKSAAARPARTVERDREEFDCDEGQLVVDVYQTPDELIISSPVAGVNPDDLDIAITTESVTIRGERQHERKVREEDYFYQECYWGRFSRTVALPQEVDADKAEANIKNGVLTIVLPKLNRQKQKKLRVKQE